MVSLVSGELGGACAPRRVCGGPGRVALGAAVSPEKTFFFFVLLIRRPTGSMGEAMLGPSAALPPRVTVGGSGRAGLSHAEVGLVLVASVMQIELCYVKEWVEYHLDHGGPRSTLYLLPQRGAPTIAATAVPDAGQERFMREFSVDHPRVHVLCNVSGMPGGCASPQAVPYLHRTSHQELMLRHLVPKRECAAPASSIPHVRHAPSMRRL